MGRGWRDRRLATVGAAILAVLVPVVAGCGDDDWTREEAIERLQTDGKTTARNDGAGGQGADGGRPGQAAGGSFPYASRIEEFGAEAGGRTRAEMAAGFHAYMNALAGGEYGVACARLSEAIRDLIKRFGSGQRQGPCPQILAALPARVKREALKKANGKVVEARVDGQRGHVIFRAPGAELYHLPMTREGGEWKAGLVSAPVLVPSS